jgi:hypothetical protein
MKLHITKRKSNKYLRGANLFLDLQFGSERIANIPYIKKNGKLTHILYIYYYYFYIYTKLYTIARVLNSYHSKSINYAIKFKKARLYRDHVSKYKQFAAKLPQINSSRLINTKLSKYKLSNYITNKLYSNSLFRSIKYKQIKKVTTALRLIQNKQNLVIKQPSYTNIYMEPNAFTSRIFRSKERVMRRKRRLLRRKFLLNQIRFSNLNISNRNSAIQSSVKFNTKSIQKRNLKRSFRSNIKFRTKKKKGSNYLVYNTPMYNYYNIKVMPWFLGRRPNKYIIYNYKYSSLYKKMYKQNFFKTIKRIIRVYTNHLLSLSSFLAHVNVSYTIRNISKLIRYVRSKFNSMPRRTTFKMYFVKKFKSKSKSKSKKPRNSLPIFRYFKRKDYNEIKKIDLIENNFNNSTSTYKIRKIALHISQYKRFVLRQIRKDPEVFNFYMTQLHFWRSIQTTYLEHVFSGNKLFTFNYVPFFLSHVAPLVHINMNVLNFSNITILNKLILFLYNYNANCVKK